MLYRSGWPANPKTVISGKSNVRFDQAKLAAFGSTRRPGNLPEEDPILQNLLSANTPVVAIFGKSWAFHVEKVLQIPLAENLALIEDSVRYLKNHHKEVIYDAEHFLTAIAPICLYTRNPSGCPPGGL